MIHMFLYASSKCFTKMDQSLSVHLNMNNSGMGVIHEIKISGVVDRVVTSSRAPSFINWMFFTTCIVSFCGGGKPLISDRPIFVKWGLKMTLCLQQLMVAIGLSYQGADQTSFYPQIMFTNVLCRAFTFSCRPWLGHSPLPRNFGHYSTMAHIYTCWLKHNSTWNLALTKRYILFGLVKF